MHKPQPEIYLLGGERVGLAPQECVFVDDLRENCEGAEAVGMTAVLHRGAETRCRGWRSCWAWSCAGLDPGQLLQQALQRDDRLVDLARSARGSPLFVGR